MEATVLFSQVPQTLSLVATQGVDARIARSFFFPTPHKKEGKGSVHQIVYSYYTLKSKECTTHRVYAESAEIADREVKGEVYGTMAVIANMT